MGTALASLGVLATRAIPALGARPGDGGSVTRYPLRIPPIVSPAGLNLTCAPGTSDLSNGSGKLSNVLAYNGSFPGPSILARTGDTTAIELHNGLSDQTITHWHGMLVDHANDGGPLLAIPPNTSYSYTFPIVQRACMNWYHPHPHMLTGEQVCLGLAGAFIVRDGEEDALGLPSGAHEVPLIVRDANLDRAGNLIYYPTPSGFKGKSPLVNGTLSPMLSVDTDLYRFRVLNGSNTRIFRLALSNGAPFIVIGNDGGLLETAVQVSQITFSPGERLDLLIEFRGLPTGTKVMLRCLDARWDLLEFNVTRAVSPQFTIPTGTLSAIETLIGPTKPTRTFSFDGMSKINGLEYDPARIDFEVPFGVVERWRFTTNLPHPMHMHGMREVAAHPVHVHGASFQVAQRWGGRGAVFPWEAGWKDTVLLQNGETVDALIRFNAYRGLYVMHCHKLEHADQGMMSNFEVV
jgi:FtsP/CotA-like multicopper oxidase with cupredoxin domain